MSFSPGGRHSVDGLQAVVPQPQARGVGRALRTPPAGPPRPLPGIRTAAGTLMDDGLGREGLSFLGRRLPPSFQLRVVAVAPGSERAYVEAEWRDALVVVERGEIEVECLGGARRWFRCGDVLWLTGLPLRALHNSGHEPAVLVAVSRRG